VVVLNLPSRSSFLTRRLSRPDEVLGDTIDREGVAIRAEVAGDLGDDVCGIAA
jgi:hypothetical protein